MAALAGGPPRWLVLGGLAAVVIVVLALGLASCVSGHSARAAERSTVDRFLRAYAARSYGAMYDEVDADAQRQLTVKQFAAMQRATFRTAGATRIVVGRVQRKGNVFVAPVTVTSATFGTLVDRLRLHLVGSGDDARVAWTRALSFPGLRPGERLTRTTDLPTRGTILFRDGTTPIAQGAGRTSTAPENVVSQVRGSLGPLSAVPAARRAALLDEGVPADAKVGVSGLERLLDDRLLGRPGGTLRAGDRVLARRTARAASAVTTSISLPVLQAAVQGQSTAPSGGGLTVLDTHTGEVLAFAGDAWTQAQPPGSTMKIVTAAAALAGGDATTSSSYPTETEALGIQNADQEACGGTLIQAFAQSCNSVFVPLAVKTGSQRFVETAEAFGFNHPAPVPGATPSTLPTTLAAGDLAQSGIGQGKVQATSLQAAMMAATVATHGVQPALTFLRTSKAARTHRVIDPDVADDLRTMMEAVITDGTGKSAAIPGVTVAGKTGTAELRATQGASCEAPDGDGTDTTTTDATPDSGSCDPSDGSDTDAWMSAFAPADGSSTDPIAVGVVRFGDHQGGATAAPVAAAVLRAALGR